MHAPKQHLQRLAAAHQWSPQTLADKIRAVDRAYQSSRNGERQGPNAIVAVFSHGNELTRVRADDGKYAVEQFSVDSERWVLSHRRDGVYGMYAAILDACPGHAEHADGRSATPYVVLPVAVEGHLRAQAPDRCPRPQGWGIYEVTSSGPRLVTAYHLGFRERAEANVSHLLAADATSDHVRRIEVSHAEAGSSDGSRIDAQHVDAVRRLLAGRAGAKYAENLSYNPDHAMPVYVPHDGGPPWCVVDLEAFIAANPHLLQFAHQLNETATLPLDAVTMTELCAELLDYVTADTPLDDTFDAAAFGAYLNQRFCTQRFVASTPSPMERATTASAAAYDLVTVAVRVSDAEGGGVDFALPGGSTSFDVNSNTRLYDVSRVLVLDTTKPALASLLLTSALQRHGGAETSRLQPQIEALADELAARLVSDPMDSDRATAASYLRDAIGLARSELSALALPAVASPLSPDALEEVRDQLAALAAREPAHVTDSMVVDASLAQVATELGFGGLTFHREGDWANTASGLLVWDLARVQELTGADREYFAALHTNVEQAPSPSM